jgi:hypothetical protein
MAVLSGPPTKGTPEALAKFLFQSCITDFLRMTPNGTATKSAQCGSLMPTTTAKQPTYKSPRLHHAHQARADAKSRFLWLLRSHLRPPANSTKCVVVLAGVPTATVYARIQTSELIMVDIEQTPQTVATTLGEPTCNLGCAPIV